MTIKAARSIELALAPLCMLLCKTIATFHKNFQLKYFCNFETLMRMQ